jgi:hypothetical protein
LTDSSSSANCLAGFPHPVELESNLTFRFIENLRCNDHRAQNIPPEAFVISRSAVAPANRVSYRNMVEIGAVGLNSQRQRVIKLGRTAGVKQWSNTGTSGPEARLRRSTGVVMDRQDSAVCLPN